MRILNAVSASLILLSTYGCGSQGDDSAASSAYQPMPYASLAQLMRAIPFPSSNTVFDTQALDFDAGQTDGEPEAENATGRYGELYGGWEGVENAALAIAETANLITMPGRLCENGLPVPVENDDFQRFAAGLRDAGLQAYRAAQARDLDAMLDAGGTVSDACAFCHEVYRDKPEGEMRCVP